MKKKLLRTFMLAAALLVGECVWADPIETVGNTDNTSAFWSVFSDYYTIQPNRSLRLSFTNHSDKAMTFHTWVGVITSDFDRATPAASDTEGYWEYLVLRGDDGRWGNSSATGTFTSNFTRSGDDDATVSEWLDGAHVELTISRSSSTVTMRADMYSKAGGYYWEQMVITAGTGTQNIRFFLTTQNGHLTDIAKNSVDASIYYFYQDYENATDYSPWTAPNITPTLTTGDTTYGKYITLTQSGNGPRSGTASFSFDDISALSSYTLEFYWKYSKSSDRANQVVAYTSDFSSPGNNAYYSGKSSLINLEELNEAASGYSFTGKFKINESTTDLVTLSANKWYRFNLSVDITNRKVTSTITKVEDSSKALNAHEATLDEGVSMLFKGIWAVVSRNGTSASYDNFSLTGTATEAITTSVSTSAVNLASGKATIAVSTETNAVSSTIKHYYSASPLLTSPVEISDGSVELASGTYYFYSVNTVSGSKSNSVRYEVEATETVSAPTVTYTGNTITLTAHGTSDAGGSIAGTYYVANAPSADPATEGTLLTLNTPTTVPQGYYYIYSVSEYGNASAEPATAMSIARSQETFDFYTGAVNGYTTLSNLGSGESGDNKLFKLSNSAGAVAEFINGRIECSYANANGNYWWVRNDNSSYYGLFVSSNKSDDLYVKVSAQDVVVFTLANGGLTFSGTPNVYGDGIVDGSAVVSGTKYMAKANGYIKVHGAAYTTIKSIVVYSDDADMVAAPVLSSSANIVNVIAGGSADDDAVITSYYTTNGDAPTTGSTAVADNKIALGPGSYTVKVMSYNATTKTASSVESIEVVVPASVSKDITAAGWATYCSPYALDLENSTGLTDAYIITGGEDGVLAKTSVKGGTVPANTGLLIKGTAGTATIPVVESSSTSVSGNKLVGVTSETILDLDSDDDGTADKNVYVLMNDDTNGLGFYLTTTTSFTVGANTAYLPSNFDGAGARSFFSLFEHDATGINAVNGEGLTVNGSVFDLQGRRVAQPTKGLYIVNGKKVVIK